MRQVVLLLTIVATTIAGALAASAEDYVDQDAQFRVTVPAGWQMAKPKKPSESTIVAFFSPRVETTSGMCLFASIKIASTQDISQDQLNEGMVSKVNEAFWRELVEDKDVKDITLVDVRSEVKHGRRGYYATARLTTTVEGTEYPEQQSLVLYMVPGRMHLGQCSVDIAQVSAEEADIKTIITSFEPTGGMIISKLDPRLAPRAEPASLVLHAGPRFDGPRRELTQDAPNLAAIGWNSVTASFNVRGYGLWQICDGVNYRGNCRIVAGAESAALGDRALRIGSARRIVDPRDPRSALGVVRDRIAEMLKLDRRQFGRPRRR